MKRKPALVPLADVRRLIADYIGSEGCSCCQSVDEHRKHATALGKLLRVKKYSDNSGYDFYRYQTTPR